MPGKRIEEKARAGEASEDVVVEVRKG